MTSITSDMKVADVIEERPKTVDVFLDYGCPDMRDGLFSMMARIMSVRSAARIHGLPLESLLEDLNSAEKTGSRTESDVRS